MLAPELLAAMASGCWAVGALFSATASNQMGAFAFTRWRLFFAMILLWGMTLMGSSVLVSGVMVAVVWGRREDENHRWENTQGTLWVGVLMGPLAAVGQAVATLMIKPLMSTGIDAVSASAVRATASFVAHLLLLWAVYRRKPAAGAWWGGAMTVVGSAMIMSSKI